jgi:Kelch motif
MKQKFFLPLVVSALIFSCKKDATTPLVSQSTSYSSVTSEGTGTTMPQPKTDLNAGYMTSAVVGGSLYLGGGDSVENFPATPSANVEIYNFSSNSWTTTDINPARDGIAVGALNGKVFFAGGYTGPSGASTVVNIYDSASGKWSSANLSVPRFGFAVASAGTKIIFAGGSTYNTGAFNFNETPSNAVDIYDVSSNTWTTSQLPEAKNFLAAASLGSKIVFAGGFNGSGYSSEADIYDVNTNTWSSAQMSQARGFLAGAAAGDDIIFGGGEITGYFPTSTVDIYNIKTGAWSSDALSVGRSFLAATAVGNLVFFGGGESSAGQGIPLTSSGVPSTVVDIYNTSTGKWLTPMSLSVGRVGLAAGSSGNTAVFAGGYGNGISNNIDIFKAK